MRRRRRRDTEAPGAVAVLDEAGHLLRLAPAGILAAFYAGSVPFVLALLYFVSDMSRSAFASRRLAAGSLVVALLYVWMKAWQAVFARRLRARLSGAAAPPLSPKAWVRLFAVQAAFQPTSLFVLPIAGFVMLPYGWAHAFYHNLGITGDYAESRRQALLWPRQNHALIFILALLGLFVFLNVGLTLVLVPTLLKSFLGIETAFSRSPASILNTTFLMTACGLTYLAVAPLARAAYVVRCFHGESLRSGEDLKADLRGLVAALVLIPALLAGAAGPIGAAPAGGARQAGAPVPARHAPAAAPAALVPPRDIERAVREVVQRPEFAWRLPRAPEADAPQGLVGRFFVELGDLTLRGFKAFGRLLERLAERLARGWSGRQRSAVETRDGLGWLTSVQGLLAVLLAVVACAAAIVFWRWRRRGPDGEAARAEAVPALPDVSVDDSAAGDTPAESWLERARDLARQGELRAAVRAVYLACLSHLAARGLLALARFKSNRDYLDELRRRARARPETVPLFEENVALFERVWYGRHEATGEMVDRSTGNFRRMRSHAEE